MEMDTSAEIKSRILRAYNTSPDGWQVYTAKDARGHTDTVFVHGNDVYVTKEEVVNPYRSIGVGIQEKLDIVKIPSAPSFGLRPLDVNTLETLLTVDDKAQRSLIGQVMSNRPVAIDNIRSPAVIHGPITHSNVPLSIMGSKQKEIDSRLREELDRLLDRKYPHLRSMYG